MKKKRICRIVLVLLSLLLLMGCGNTQEMASSSSSKLVSGSIEVEASSSSAVIMKKSSSITVESKEKEISNVCIICGKAATKFIDGDWWCTEDAKVIEAANEADAGLDKGEYWCMGKNDTCQNKTSSPYDLFCNTCDPDGDNIEG